MKTTIGTSRILVLYLIVFLSSSVLLASAQDAEPQSAATTTVAEDNNNSNNEHQEEAAKPKPVEEEQPAFMAAEPDQWGSYYDPQQEFCGKYDCYRILGFDYEEGHSPDTKEITKRYRRLSRKWHPDKSKHPKAKERFVKIVRAYEVLTNNEKRKEYDFMRYNQEAYYQKYGASVLWKYAPKSDVTIIGTILFILVNAISWFAQKNKWQNVADRLIKAAAEDWSSSQGGSPESKELREHALALLAERENNEDAETSSNGAAEKSSKKAKGKKVSGKEKKKQELEALIPVLKELVDEMHDFGGGFHKPTWRDLLIVNLAMLPYKLAVGIVWEAKYYMNRLQGKELNDEEKEVLTARAVGPVVWDLASDETRETMIKRELWILNNLVEWKEEEEIKNLSAWEQKAIRKAQKAEKKKGSKQA